MKFEFLVSQAHWADHLRPIWSALPAQERGRFSRYLDRGKGAVVVAAISDHNRVKQSAPMRPVILFEHGAGFSFHGQVKGNHPSYAGGRGRDRVSLFPAVNHWAADRNREAYPDIPAPIVGCPKLDRLSKIPDPGNGVVAISFHWDCRVAPETRWALPHYLKALEALGGHFQGRIIGHAHPRETLRLARYFRSVHIPMVTRFDEVLERASVYVNDASSTLYEFASTGRPVVVLNAPWYRRDVSHGLRFWDRADVGINVNEPADLVDGIEEALKDRMAQRRKRERAIAEVYPFLGASVPQAVAVLREWALSREMAVAV